MENLSGRAFGLLTCVKFSHKIPGSIPVWLCQCRCGGSCTVRAADLKNGHTRSCGCLRPRRVKQKNFATTHGKSYTPEHKCWRDMISRCTNPKNTCWHLYGARGITVCDRWLNSFENFLSDMGPKPGPKFSIDRFPDMYGGYRPDNCRWATQKQQVENSRRFELQNLLGIS